MAVGFGGFANCQLEHRELRRATSEALVLQNRQQRGEDGLAAQEALGPRQGAELVPAEGVGMPPKDRPLPIRGKMEVETYTWNSLGGRNRAFMPFLPIPPKYREILIFLAV